MSQPEMKDLLSVVDEQVESKRLANQVRWENWGRSIGLLTPEAINRQVHANWQWDDYAI